MLVPAPNVAPVTPASLAVQENVVPGVPPDIAMEVVPPEQKVIEEGVAIALGVGFTVTVSAIDGPEHCPIVGVIV